ncbi:MAG: radical SAM protein, partial [Planctomycetota bacterium]
MMNDVTLVHLSLSALRPVPVGLLYIAAVLRRAGYLLDFQDLHGSHRIEDCADVVGIGYMSDALPRALKTAETLKRQHPGKTVILGGPGPSAVAREIVSSFPYIDVVVIGEGEETILEVMDCLARDDRSRLSKVDGICCRIDGQVVQTPARERIRDLDALPLPLYDCIPMEEYPLINVVSSRGCPYRCTFCDVSPMWQRKHFRRSVESVVNELILLKERYGKTEIEFTDETFVLNRDKVSTFCERLRRERIEVRWACTGRVDLVTEDLLAEMASSGCGALFYGLESGSDVVLEKIDKRFTVGEALAAIHMTRQYMHVAASFIWGFPFEEINELVETLL